MSANRPLMEVIPTPIAMPWGTFFTGAGDAAGSPIGRGTGTQAVASYDGNETGAELTKTVEWEYLEAVMMHTGALLINGTWSLFDRWELSIDIPKNIPIVNGAGAGNVNLSPIEGGGNMIIPAPGGDGTHDLDLVTDAHPLPVRDGVGAWNLGSAATGEIVPALDKNGNAKGWCHLLDIAKRPFFARNMPAKDFMPLTSKAEYLHPNYGKLRLRMTKVTPHEGDEFAGLLYLFRVDTT